MRFNPLLFLYNTLANIIKMTINNADLINNLLYPLILAFILGIVIIMRKKITEFFKQKSKKKITLSLKVDKESNLIIDKKTKFISKITLIKHFIRENEDDKYSFNITPNYRLKGVNKFQKEEYYKRLEKKSKELKEKIKILFYRENDLRIETDTEFIFDIIKNILKKSSFIQTGTIKLDIYRNTNPKISFPIFITKSDFETLSNEQQISKENYIQQLSIPTMTTMSIFSDEMYTKYIFPSFIREMYRLKENFDFDFEQSHWDSLITYEVGLG